MAAVLALAALLAAAVAAAGAPSPQPAPAALVLNASAFAYNPTATGPAALAAVAQKGGLATKRTVKEFPALLGNGLSQTAFDLGPCAVRCRPSRAHLPHVCVQVVFCRQFVA